MTVLLAGSLVATAISLFILYPLSLIIYNIYLHPLHKFPGPKLWTSTAMTRHIYAILGDMDAHMRDLHAKYGPVVRYTPDGLSFITPQAWIDIYSYGHSLPRDKNFYVFTNGSGVRTETMDVFTALDDGEHSRIRRHISHPFADKAVQEMEPRIKSHNDFFIERVKSVSALNGRIDLSDWYKFVTFDTVGDLSFGQSFGCLERNGFHPMVAFIFCRLKSRPWFHFAEDFPIVRYFLPLITPKSITEGRAAVAKYMIETVGRRIAQGTDTEQKDFMHYILRNNDEKTRLSEAEMMANARSIVVAGSETTATLLTAVTYSLLKNPETYRKAEREVREAFSHPDEISGLMVAKLPYVMACIDEALRMFPPGPSWTPRRTAKTTDISGYNIPPNTSVAVHPWSASTSETNFHLAHSFIPERWLPTLPGERNPFANDNRDVVKPFSVGPRNCIGQNLARAEMRRILALMLWTFDWELCDESKQWEVGMKTWFSWERHPLFVRLKEREV